MPFYVNTNIASLTAQMNLTNTQNSLATSLQRLSSGLRINSAKDDAAGLAISQRMSALIGGLNQAQRNANDGISLAQTAEGALGTIGTNLQTLLTLAVQSSNSTNTSIDRAAIQTQAAQIIAQIDQTAATTQFNGANLLDGSFQNMAFQIGADVGQTTSISINSARASNLGSTQSASLTAYNNGTALSQGDLTINGTTVGPSLATYDNASYANNADSAIAKVAAINAVTSQTGVTAMVNTNIAAGGAQTAGASTGTLTINGVQTATISTSGSASADRLAVVNAINAISGKTGVTAVDTGLAATGIQLQAADGRNITYSFNGGLTGATTGLTHITGGTMQSAASALLLNGVNGVSAVTASNALAGTTATNVLVGVTATTGTAASQINVVINGVSLGVYTLTGTANTDMGAIQNLINTSSTLAALGVTAVTNSGALNVVSTQGSVTVKIASIAGSTTSLSNVGMAGGATTFGYVAGGPASLAGVAAIGGGGGATTMNFSVNGVAIAITLSNVSANNVTAFINAVNTNTTLSGLGITASLNANGGANLTDTQGTLSINNSGGLTLSWVGLTGGSGTSVSVTAVNAVSTLTINNVQVNVTMSGTLSTDVAHAVSLVNANTSLAALGITATVDATTGGIDLKSTQGDIIASGTTGQLLGMTSGSVGVPNSQVLGTTAQNVLSGATLAAATSNDQLNFYINGVHFALSLTATSATNETNAIALINSQTGVTGVTAAVNGTTGGIDLTSTTGSVNVYYDTVNSTGNASLGNIGITGGRGSSTAGGAGQLTGITATAGGAGSLVNFSIAGVALSLTLTGTSATDVAAAASLINASASLAALGITASVNSLNGGLNIKDTQGGFTITNNGTGAGSLNNIGVAATGTAAVTVQADAVDNIAISGVNIAVTLSGTLSTDVGHAVSLINANTSLQTLGITATVNANGGIDLTSTSGAITSSGTSNTLGNVLLGMTQGSASAPNNVFTVTVNGQAISITLTASTISVNVQHAASLINAQTASTGVAATYNATTNGLDLTSTTTSGVTASGSITAFGMGSTNSGTANSVVNLSINGTAIAVTLTGVYSTDVQHAQSLINAQTVLTGVSASIVNGEINLNANTLAGVNVTSTASAGASVGNVGLVAATTAGTTGANISFSINGQALTYTLTGVQSTDLNAAASLINSFSNVTGVSATLSLDGIYLSSLNGNAVTLTGGTGTATLLNLGLKSGATAVAATSPVNYYGTYSLSSSSAITIGGGTGIADSGMVAGSYNTQTAYATTATGSSTAFTSGDFTINGIMVGSSSANSDTASTTGNAASAIAKVAAINSVSSQTHVTATVNANMVAGSAQTAAASSGTLTINGITTGTITTGGANATSDRLSVITAINAISGQTGVVASDSGSAANGINLTAADGRNIVFSYGGTLTASSTGLSTNTSTHYGTFSLSSASQFTVAQGTNSVDLTAEGMLAAGTYGAGKTGGALSNLDLSTAQNATNAITAINNAINSVNTIRANLGAIQNRFTNVITSLQNTTTNLSAANSRIMDADFAAETANLSRSQILQQAGTAMLAQANQLPSSVLSLLK